MSRYPLLTLIAWIFLFQACIAGALTKGDDDEGPCPKCKATMKLDDLTPIGGHGGSGGGGSADGGKMETGRANCLQEVQR